MLFVGLLCCLVLCLFVCCVLLFALFCCVLLCFVLGFRLLVVLFVVLFLNLGCVFVSLCIGVFVCSYEKQCVVVCCGGLCLEFGVYVWCWELVYLVRVLFVTGMCFVSGLCFVPCFVFGFLVLCFIWGFLFRVFSWFVFVYPPSREPWVFQVIWTIKTTVRNNVVIRLKFLSC